MEGQESAFEALKQYPNFSKDVILTTDVSNEGARKILSQGD
jgi:hypothetical protein